jgi:hypothetical protein
VHYGGDEALEARVDSLESGDAWSNKTIGYVPVVQEDGSIEWEAAPSGGALDPTEDVVLEDGAALRLSDTASGAVLDVVQDTDNFGSGQIGVYPNSEAGFSGLVLFGPGAERDGSVATPFVFMDAGEFASQVGAQGTSGLVSAVAKVQWNGSEAVGRFAASADGASTPSAEIAAQFKHGFEAVVTIMYDGTIRWSNDTEMRRVAPGVLGILADGGGIQFTSPDGLTTKTLSIDNSGDPVWT